MSTYKTSDTTATLFAAVSVAQSQFAGAKKDAVNPAFRSKYADLASVWDAVREHLTANGLAIIQIPTAIGPVATVTTILTHKSGEWLSDDLSITSDKNTAQGLGSAITYARRYALSAFLGIAPEDDDGNEASKGKTDAPVAQKRQEQPKQAPAPIGGDMKTAFAEVKSKIGDRLYGFILSKWNIKDPSELDREAAKVMYKQMGLANKAIQAASHGEIIQGMTPEVFGCLSESSVAEIMKQFREKLKALAGTDVAVEEYEDARRSSTDQWDLAIRLQMKIDHLAKAQGIA